MDFFVKPISLQGIFPCTLAELEVARLSQESTLSAFLLYIFELSRDRNAFVNNLHTGATGARLVGDVTVEYI